MKKNINNEKELIFNKSDIVNIQYKHSSSETEGAVYGHKHRFTTYIQTKEKLYTIKHYGVIERPGNNLWRPSSSYSVSYIE